MTYKESLTAAMDGLAKDPRVIFIGYGITTGYALGTLKNVLKEQLLETPVAENLMVGMAIGMALKGRLPVVFIERMDFILNAMDAIVNHLAASSTISRNEFRPAVIIRTVVGNKKKPLFTGETHTQDLSHMLEGMNNISVRRLNSSDDVTLEYGKAIMMANCGVSSVLVEYKDLI